MKRKLKKEMKRRIQTGTNPLLVAKWLSTYNKVKKGLRK